MSKATKYSLVDLKRDFSNDAVAVEFIFDARHSRKCSCSGVYQPLFKWDTEQKKLIGRRQFQCSTCRYQIAPTAGTIFHKSDTPLSLWFHAIWVFSNAKSGISAKEMERQLGVTYKTAWRILKLIRTALGQGGKKLKGDVEMDEAYFGGHHYGGKNNKQLGRSMRKKSVVIAAVKRDGAMKAEVVPNATADTIGQFLNKNVAKDGTRLLTDESNRYDRVAKGYDRHMVNHSQSEFVRGDVHINHIETFWAHVKRSMKGTHKVISKQYLQSYLDGFVFHYNNRSNDNQRFVDLLSILLHA